MSDNGLGEFLRAHRARVRPEDVGLVSYGRRRVAGLRREEVAVLAGMNTDYYARLEQSRERSPSAQVVAAIGGALRMDDEALDHLYRLAGAAPPGRAAQPHKEVGPALRRLLEGYADTPAFVLDPALNIVSANAAARALFSPFERADNLARMAFLDPAARRFYPNWPRVAEATVAELRRSSGLEPSYGRLRDLVHELEQASGEFAELWASQAVHGKTHGTKELVHPDVGPLSLRYESFDVRGAHGRQVVIYHARPDSADAQALTLLGTLAATRSREPSADR